MMLATLGRGNFNKKIFQLRYLQTLNSISAENNSTIVFPVPVDILSSMMGNMQVQQQQVKKEY